MKLALYAVAGAAALAVAQGCEVDIEAAAKCAVTQTTAFDVRPQTRFAAATLAHCVSLHGHEQQRVQSHG